MYNGELLIWKRTYDQCLGKYNDLRSLTILRKTLKVIVVQYRYRYRSIKEKRWPNVTKDFTPPPLSGPAY